MARKSPSTPPKGPPKKPPKKLPPLVPPAPPKRRRKFFHMEEWRALLEAAKDSSVRDTALLKIMYFAGLRASEPGLLRMSYAEKLEEGQLFVWRGKGSRSEWIDLEKATQDALLDWVEDWKPKEFLFPAGRRHKGPLKGISRGNVWSIVKRLARDAGVAEEIAMPHAIKHSRVQHVLEAAENTPDMSPQKVLLAVAQIVGHQSAMTTIQHYAAATAGATGLMEKVTKEALNG